MDFILLNYSLWVEARVSCLFVGSNALWVAAKESRLFLFVGSNGMLFSSETSIGARYIILIDQNYSILDHWSIATVFKGTIVQSFASELVLVGLRIVTTIVCYRDTFQCSGTPIWKDLALLPCYLCSSQRVRWEKVLLEPATELSLQ